MMAWAALPAWLSSSAVWFLVVNAVVAAVAVLSRAGPPLPPLPSPRRGSSSGGVTRRASSAVMQRLRSFSIFSFPSACFNTTPPPLPQPDAPTAAAVQETGTETEEPPRTPAKTAKTLPRANAAAQETETETETEEPPRTPATTAKTLPRALPLPPSPLSSSPSGRARAADADDDEEDDGDEPTGMSMDEAYALALEARRRPDRETEEEARRSDVDAKAEEFIRGFKEDLRQQRLNSIFNYTQMLKQRALGGGATAAARRQPDQL